MTPEDLKNTVIVPVGSFAIKQYPNGQRFVRLGLTLSKKGWTASIQWEGTSGARGTGKTQEEAISDALNTVKTAWNRMWVSA